MYNMHREDKQYAVFYLFWTINFHKPGSLICKWICDVCKSTFVTLKTTAQ